MYPSYSLSPVYAYPKTSFLPPKFAGRHSTFEARDNVSYTGELARLTLLIKKLIGPVKVGMYMLDHLVPLWICLEGGGLLCPDTLAVMGSLPELGIM